MSIPGGEYTLELNDSYGDGFGFYCDPGFTGFWSWTVEGQSFTTLPNNYGSSISYSLPVGCEQKLGIRDGSAVDWYSKELDISQYEYVDISVDVSENGDAGNDGFVLSTLIDGGAATAQLTDTDGDFVGTRSVTSITGDVLIVKFESVGSGDMFFDDVTVTGYCVDLDGNDICDSEQDCVETAGKDCGCMDKTACTYEADATHASADSCFYPGMPFQGAACGSAGQFNFYGSDCNCASSDWTSVYSENFDDETAQDGYYFGTFTDVSGVDDPSTDGWEINLETSPNNPYQVAVDGMFSGLNAVDGTRFCFRRPSVGSNMDQPGIQLDESSLLQGVCGCRIYILG